MSYSNPAHNLTANFLKLVLIYVSNLHEDLSRDFFITIFATQNL
jgi:hypothetical protein